MSTGCSLWILRLVLVLLCFKEATSGKEIRSSILTTVSQIDVTLIPSINDIFVIIYLEMCCTIIHYLLINSLSSELLRFFISLSSGFVWIGKQCMRRKYRKLLRLLNNPNLKGYFYVDHWILCPQLVCTRIYVDRCKFSL